MRATRRAASRAVAARVDAVTARVVAVAVRVVAVAVRGVSVAALAALAAACSTVGPDYRRPAVSLPATYGPAAGAVAVAPALQARWWTLYGDPVLDGLVEQALAANPDVRIAAARIDEAEAVLRQAEAARLPQVDVGASAGRSRSSQAVPSAPGAPSVGDSYRIALSTSFELDFWGRLRRADEAARARALGTRHALDVTALTLTGATAQAYFALRAADAQIAATRRTLANRDETLEVIGVRAAAGLASDVELSQSRVARAEAALQLAELERQRGTLLNQVAVLTGRPGTQVSPGDLSALPVPPAPPAGLPSQLLERRPDVAQAEEALVAANALIGVARAQQLPTVSLTGALGALSAELGDIVKAGARIWSAALGATLPIFDSGRYAARTREAEAVAAQAAGAYEKAVQAAFREVADALVNTQAAARAEAEHEARIQAARRALELGRLRYDAGYSPYLEVLDAQRTVNAAELAAIQNRQARLSYSVDLMKALGGGWSAPARAGR